MLKKLQNNNKVKLLMTVAMATCLAVSSFAQTAPDFEDTITAAQTGITTTLTTYGPLVMGILMFVFGFRFITRWIFRAIQGL